MKQTYLRAPAISSTSTPFLLKPISLMWNNEQVTCIGHMCVVRIPLTKLNNGATVLRKE